MLPHKIRVRMEEAVKANIAELYRMDRESGLRPLDPFALRFGPELQRRPWAKRLFDDHMLLDHIGIAICGLP